ncbi:MAG: phosphoribosylformylglycinamidine synthase I [Methanomicrobiales archaeon]|nr:phosphoribosylformylglycinamidine synthase I [Methanomicrobiales archaeon]
MRFAVLRFGGSNCDLDTYRVLTEVCGVDTDLVWYKEGLKRTYDAVIIPGGFSYGDYLRAGAIASRTPLMREVRRHAKEGGLVLGICNGAQIGTECGLAPGAFTINEYPKFICRQVHIRVENVLTPFTSRFRVGEVIRIPIAHKEGRYVAHPEALERMNANGQVVFRFCDSKGELTPESNPNGSLEYITGIANEQKNVLLMMPHPERASEEILGSRDAKRVFESMIDAVGAGSAVTTGRGG